MRGFAEGGFQFADVPEFKGVVAAAGDDEAAVGGDVEAGGPGGGLVGGGDFGGWAQEGAVAVPDCEGAVECCGCEEGRVSRVVSGGGAVFDGCHAASTGAACLFTFVDDHGGLLSDAVRVPNAESAVCAGCDEYLPLLRMPVAAGDLADVPFGVMHVTQVHVAFGGCAKKLAFSTVYSGLW